MVSLLPCLTVTEGEGKGTRFMMEEFPFTIGRAPECSLALDVPGISRLHARINRAYGQYTLIDTNSTNGTFVNGQRIRAETLLYDGDEICFASAICVCFEDPAATDQIDVRELSLGGIQVNDMRREVFVDGKLVEPPLSPSQYVLLEALIRHEGQVVTREEIAAAVWPDEKHITDQMIDTLVSRLRKRLAEYDADQHVVTRRGFGLMFTRK